MDSCPFFSEPLYFSYFLDSWFELEPVLDLSLVFFFASWVRSTLSFCSLASFVEKTSYSRFSLRPILRCFGYKYTHYWLRSDFTSSSVTMPLLKLRCVDLFRLRNVVIEIISVFALIKGKQADFHHKCECVIAKTYATGNARTKSMVYSTSYQTYRKSQIMWFVDLSVAVKALAFEVKIVTVTARFGVFQVFIIEECCRFLHARR